MMLLDAETNEPCPEGHRVYAVGHPDNPMVSAISSLRFRATDPNFINANDLIDWNSCAVGPDDLVLYEANSTIKDGVYTLKDFRNGAPKWIVPAAIASKVLPRSWKLYRKSSDEREHIVVYRYSVPDGETWYGEEETREAASELGFEHFGGNEIVTRKEHRTCSDEQTHRRKGNAD